MRVITGTARGRRLKTLEGMDVRPTTDKVKEAIFSAIQFEIEGADVLDLFAGSGQLGIEAMSRGAKSAVFVDKSKASVEVVRENLASTSLSEHTRVVNMDSLDMLRNTRQKFDIAFLDPPYNKGILEEVLPLLEKCMNENGKVICEHETGLKLPEKIGRMYLKKVYRYGKINVSIYSMEEIAQ